MPTWLWGLLKGAGLGIAGATINYLILQQANRRMQKRPEKANATLGICYLLRFAVSVGTLLLAFFYITKDTLFLVGVAFGLTIPGYFYFLFFKRKQNFEGKE